MEVLGVCVHREDETNLLKSWCWMYSMNRSLMSRSMLFSPKMVLMLFTFSLRAFPLAW